MGNLFSTNNNNNGGGENGRGQQGGFLSAASSMIFKIIIMQMVLSWMRGGNKQSNSSTGINNPSLSNVYYKDMKFDMFVYLSGMKLQDWDSAKEQGQLIWEIPDLNYTYSFFAKPAASNYTINVDESLLNPNQDLFVTTAVVPHYAYEERLDPLISSTINPEYLGKIITVSTSLIKWMEPFTASELLSLVGGNEMEIMELEKQERKATVLNPKEPKRHVMTAVDIQLLYDVSNVTRNTLTSQPGRVMGILEEEGLYIPGLLHSYFWLVERDFINLDDAALGTTITLRLTGGTKSLWILSLQSQMDMTMDRQHSMGLQTRKEGFMFKRILLDTHPYMLAFSIVFMLLHSVFSFFAFKNDMQFWYKNDSMEGLSALSVVFSLVCEIIIGLYLFDSAETSWLLMFEIVMGIALSFWKVTKAVHISLKPQFPFVQFSAGKNYVESSTKKYDEVAIKWTSLALLPCIIGYAIYALYRFRYRSWYSYCVSVLAGGVYTFGFIMMTPQLYINYKLKSVDHLPWRALMYKSLNTFVDDVASFLIDMPWMHRLSCFRDDIIFIIYLYQRWIYKEDKTRQINWVSVAPPEEKALEKADEQVVKEEEGTQKESQDIDSSKAIVSGYEEAQTQDSVHLRKR